MLSDSRIEEIQKNLLKLYNQIEDRLIINIAKRFKFDEVGGGSAEWQTEKLNQIVGINRENTREVARLARKTNKEVEQVFSKMGYESVENDEKIFEKAVKKGIINLEVPAIRQSEPMARILSAGIQNAKDVLNLTNTIAIESASQEFLNIVNTAFIEVSSGTFDYNRSVKRAVIRLTQKGITGQTYTTSTGSIIRYPLDSAVRREVITSSLQTARLMQDQRAQEYGSDLIEVTSHLGARPKCARDQGKIYSTSGLSRKYPPRSRTSEGQANGLFGVNCRHQYFPYFEGISTKTFEPFGLKENEKIFKESQIQRRLEVSIRKQKLKLIGLEQIGDTEGFTTESVRLKNKEKKLKDFLKTTGRTQQPRTATAGFTRSISQKAIQANRRATSE